MEKGVVCSGIKNGAQELRLGKRSISFSNAGWRKQEWDAGPQRCRRSSHVMAFVVSAQIRGKVNC